MNLTAQQLSGEHIGKIVTVHDSHTYTGILNDTGINQYGLVWVSLTRGFADHYAVLNPNTPITIQKGHTRRTHRLGRQTKGETMKPYMLANAIIYATLILLATLGYHDTENPTPLQNLGYGAGVFALAYLTAYTIHHGKKDEE